MSLGQGGHGEKVDEDGDFVLYRYGCYSYNIPNKCDCVLDGFILIDKIYFLKTRREKAEETLNESQVRFKKFVSFENCSHCFQRISPFGIDSFSYFLIRELEEIVMETKEFPNQVHVYQ